MLICVSQALKEKIETNVRKVSKENLKCKSCKVEYNFENIV